MKTLRELALLIAGVGLAVFGLASALRAPAPGSEPPAADASAPSVVATTAATVAREIVEVPREPTVTVEGVPDSVTRVLAAAGYAGRVTESSLTETLPPSVVRVLIDHGATLTVAQEAGS
ncbi:MAG TPA: hypothetical protein VLD62_12380 [Acidimicrobiia bacterium]|nr:hypothetical protein [Acidimicrobiia bacterium]